MATSGRELKRYQLMWQPSFPATINGKTRIYVIGEKKKYVGDAKDKANLTPELFSYDPNTFNTEEIIRVGYNSTLILPFNTSVALAQEYTPQLKNKVVQYQTLGGNSITTFGAAIKKVGLAIKVIKAGRLWESYVNGLEAMSYLSANQGRYFGALYLLGYDNFSDGTQRYLGKYKVTIESLDMSQRSDSNTTLSADLRMLVLQDYSHKASNKARIWGSL
jgi:hypothetical protein